MDDREQCETAEKVGESRVDGARLLAASEHSEVERLVRRLDELERVVILRTVDDCATIGEAASMLRISERTLYYRLEEYRSRPPARCRRAIIWNRRTPVPTPPAHTAPTRR